MRGNLWPRRFDFSHYGYVFEKIDTLPVNLFNSVYVTGATVLITTVCAVLAGLDGQHAQRPRTRAPPREPDLPAAGGRDLAEIDDAPAEHDGVRRRGSGAGAAQEGEEGGSARHELDSRRGGGRSHGGFVAVVDGLVGLG